MYSRTLDRITRASHSSVHFRTIFPAALFHLIAICALCLHLSREEFQKPEEKCPSSRIQSQSQRLCDIREHRAGTVYPEWARRTSLMRLKGRSNATRQKPQSRQRNNSVGSEIREREKARAQCVRMQAVDLNTLRI